MKESLKIKIAIILTLIGVSSIIIGTTFAIYENTINAGKSQVIKTGIVNFTLTESTNGLVLDNLQELIDYDGMAQEEYYEFTIKNTGSTITDYEISLVDKTSTSYTGTILDDKYVKAGLLKNNSEEIIVNLEEANRLIDKVTLDIDESVNYKLRLWLDFGDLEDEAKEALVGQKIFLALKINGIQNMDSNTLLKSVILGKNNSNVITTGGTGLFLSTLTNDGTPTYYYKGNVNNNYVEFANILWRIVRINEDGSIRLIMEEHIDENYTVSYNNKDEKTSLYLNLVGKNNNVIFLVTPPLPPDMYNKGYTYGTDFIDQYYSESSAKTTLENWYSIYLTKYDSFIQESIFCEEFKVNYNSYSSFTPVYYEEYIPSFTCNNDENGKGILNLKIGLINIDEALMSGLNFFETSSSFLVDSSNYWIMSDSGIDADSHSYVWSIKNDQISVNSTVHKQYLKPVINLISNVQITGGSGTSGDPYTLGL